MTETPACIRWEELLGGNFEGYVGSVTAPMFEVHRTSGRGATQPWALRSDLLEGYSTGTHPDEMKDEAERWLAGFVSSLGAVFPEPEKPDPDCEECGFGLPRHDKDCSHYAMTCKHCKKPIIRCDALPSHFGCSSAYGYIHDNPRAHACEPRSDGPYAQPESDHA